MAKLPFVTLAVQKREKLPNAQNEILTYVYISRVLPARAVKNANFENVILRLLIRQRPPTPLCRGPEPYCGENSEPGRHSVESLTSNPELENSQDPKPTFVV